MKPLRLFPFLLATVTFMVAMAAFLIYRQSQAEVRQFRQEEKVRDGLAAVRQELNGLLRIQLMTARNLASELAVFPHALDDQAALDKVLASAYVDLDDESRIGVVLPERAVTLGSGSARDLELLDSLRGNLVFRNLTARYPAPTPNTAGPLELGGRLYLVTWCSIVTDGEPRGGVAILRPMDSVRAKLVQVAQAEGLSLAAAVTDTASNRLHEVLPKLRTEGLDFEVPQPLQRWQLKAAPVGGWDDWSTGDTIATLGALLASALLGFLVYSWAQRPQLLQERVEEATAKLKASQQAVTESEATLRELYEATSSATLNFEEKLDAVLKIGTRHFGLTAGFLIKPKDGLLQLEAAHDRRGRIWRGTVRPVSQPQTAEVLASGAFRSLHAIPESEITDESEWRAFAGVPVACNGQTVAALVFVGVAPRAEDFSFTQLAILQMMADWVGNEFDRFDASKRLRHLLYSQEILTRLSTRFINLPLERVKSAVMDGLQDLAEMTNHEQALIYLSDDNGESYQCQYRWHAEGALAVPKGLERIRIAKWTWLSAQLKNEPVVAVARVEELPMASRKERLFARILTVKSFVVARMGTGAATQGIIVLTSPKENQDWPAESLNLLSIAAQTFLNLLDRKAAQEELNRSRGRLDSIISSLDAVVWSGSPTEHKLLYMSPAAQKLYHRSRDAFLSDPNLWMAVVHPEDRPRVGGYTHTLHKRGSVRMEYRIVRPSGEVRWVTDHGNVVYDENGQAIRLDGLVVDITDRKTAEFELRRGQQRLRLFVKHTPAAIAMFDRDMRYMMVSDRWIADYNVSETNLLGRRHYDVFPETPERWKRIHERCLQGHASRADEDLFIRSDGRSEYIRWEVHPWYDRQDSVGGIVMFTEVITASLRQRQELQLYQQRLKSILGGAPLVCFSVDAQGIFTLAEGRGLELLRMSPEDLVGKTIDTLRLPQMIGDWRRTLQGESFTTIQDWHGYVFETVYSPVRDPDGVVVGAMSVATDITARSAAETALRESEQRFRQFAAAAQEGILIHDQGRIVDANERLAQLFGWKLSEMIGKDAIDMVAPESREVAYPHINHNAEDAYSLVAIRADGTRFPAEVYGRPIPYQGHSARVAIVRDVTVQKQTEEALLKAKEEAESGAKAKSQFLATMSHEIRTPLNGIIGLTELLLLTPLGRQQVEYVSTVKGSGELLLSIVNDILDFSKIEAGKLELERARFNLRMLVDDVAELLGHRAHSKNLELLCDIRPEVPSLVVGDQSRLRQVLVNLVTNAIKFTEEGMVLIRVQLMETDADKTTVMFEVEDTGIGISESGLARLFQPFSQVDASTTRRYGGTGLGLTISRQIVRAAGGEMNVVTAVGRGSTFSFFIPFGTSSETEESQVIRSRSRLRQLKVLIVDDLPMSRFLLSRMLQAWGCATVERGDLAGDGFAGMPPFEAALVDYRVWSKPSARQFRADLARRPLPVIVLKPSAQAIPPEELQEFRLLGAVSKPVKESVLLEALVGLLQREEITSHIMGPATVTSRDGAPPNASLAVLLVEDNRVNQLVAVQMLQVLGIVCDQAADGLEAVAATAAKHYDVIFMDVQMPHMDGLQATREIRSAAGPSQSSIIIAMTANAMKGDRERCLEAGMNDYLTKPVSLKALREAIDRHTRNRSGVIEPQKKASAPAVPEGPLPVNLARIEEILGSDIELQRQIVEIFVQDTRQRLLEIRKALGAADLDVLRRQSHTIKGASANMGAEKLQEVARAFETAAKGRDLAAMAALMEELESEATTVRRFFEERHGCTFG